MTAKRTRRGEFKLIADLFSPLTRGAPGALGLTDDVALIDVRPGYQLVTTTDTVIAGVHFRGDDPPGLVARKALRVNLSDLAAKGARPIGFLHAISLNPSIDDAYLERYAAGLRADVKEFALPLLGGDTTSGPGPLTITITAFGEVKKGAALLRRGAQPGDILCVSGTIGDSAVGLACLNAVGALPAALAKQAIGRYHLSQPRLSAGRALLGLATACLDISDGLVADVGHLCKASGVTATIERDKIPLSKGMRAALKKDTRCWDYVLGGGDDYELAFTVPPKKIPKLAKLSTKLGVSLTPIGLIHPSRKASAGSVTVLSEGQAVAVSRSGYSHR